MTNFKHRRVSSPATLARYHREHPLCEVCKAFAMPTPHHLVHPGGDDDPAVLLSLCWRHHVGPEGWHPLGKHRWFERFKDRLLPAARRKVEAVLRLKR